MVPTTRSRGANAPANSNDDELSSNVKTSTNVTKNSKSTTNKVYRKAPPKVELQQLQFPTKRKTVRAKKTRHSLPNPTAKAEKGRKNDEDEELKQKTLTQMRWTDFVVPSTFPSDAEAKDDVGSEGERLAVDLTIEDNGEGSSALVPATTSSAGKPLKKKKTVQVIPQAEVRKATNRGRKRRKTTGDLELELEYEGHEEEEEGMSRSKYHTQTLTQMPSWKGLAEMVPGSMDEELGFGLDDELPAAAHLDDATSPNKRRRSLINSEHELIAPQNPLPQPPDSTISSSAIPETPSRQRTTRTEIPSSQPSPFTPNLGILARYYSPLGALGVDRTPLKERSTNVDAPTPTVRNRTRSEIPDSWSTLNGGLHSSNENSSAKRDPLKEIHWADVSVELGENDRDDETGTAEEGHGETALQRPANDIIMDSDDEFEGFPDIEMAVPTTSPPGKQSSQEPAEEEKNLIDEAVSEPTGEKARVEGIDGSTPLVVDFTDGHSASRVAHKLDDTREKAEEAMRDDADEVVSSTPARQITAPQGVTTIGSRTNTSNPEHRLESVGADGEKVVKPTPSTPKSATQPSSTRCIATRRSSTPERPAGDDMTTPTQTLRETATQQPSSHAVVERRHTPEVAGEEIEDETEPETPNPLRRCPSNSSAVAKETPVSSPQKTSPVMPPMSQVGYKSQAFESQRVPFEIIQQMAPQTNRSDVIISADSDEVKQITDGACTHIFRDFRIPRQVVRVWLYTTAPVCQVKFMAAVSDWKMPGDINCNDQGVDIADFNANKGTKYAYELLQVYELNNPVSLERMKADGWVEQAPLSTGITYIPPGPLGALMGNLKWALFEEHGDESQSHHLGAVTVSQEVEEQLRSDLEHSTQLMRVRPLSSPAKPRPQDTHAEDLHDDDHMVVPSSQDEMKDHVRATPMRTKFSSKKQVVFAKPHAAPSHSQLSMIDLDGSPPVARHSPQQSQRIVKSTVRPSQATTVSAPSQSQQHERTVDFVTISESPSPAQPTAADKSSSLPRVVDDSPIQMRSCTVGGQGGHTQSSSLGLGALLASSQDFGLAGIGGEQDSLMDDSKIRMPPDMDMDDVIWDSEGEE